MGDALRSQIEAKYPGLTAAFQDQARRNIYHQLARAGVHGSIPDIEAMHNNATSVYNTHPGARKWGEDNYMWGHYGVGSKPDPRDYGWVDHGNFGMWDPHAYDWYGNNASAGGDAATDTTAATTAGSNVAQPQAYTAPQTGSALGDSLAGLQPPGQAQNRLAGLRQPGQQAAQNNAVGLPQFPTFPGLRTQWGPSPIQGHRFR